MSLRLQLGVSLERFEPAQEEVGRIVTTAEQLRPSENRVERRAQLVRQARQELVFDAVGALGLLAGGALDHQEGRRGFALFGHVDERADAAAEAVVLIEERSGVFEEPPALTRVELDFELHSANLGALARGLSAAANPSARPPVRC